jgi:peptidase S41-like protein
MSEKLYTLLLRLYPAAFRRKYGDDALQLLRDRLRDERGFLSRLRLWFDLLVDLGLSLPSEYRRAPSTLVPSPTQPKSGLPSFHMLESELPPPGMFLFGAVLAFASLGVLGFLLNHAGETNLFRSSSSQASPPPPLPSSPSPTSAKQLPPDSGAQSSELTPPHPDEQSVVSPAATAVPQTPDLGDKERRRVIDAVITNLTQHYVDQDATHKISGLLATHEKNGDYNTITSSSGFAGLLTKQIQDATQDAHLMVIYSQQPIPDRPPGPPAGALDQYRAAMKQQNCTFERVEMLPHDIGYLKLNSFPDPGLCRATAVAAMARLNHAGAIIFDLRDNRGGYPDMVSLIASYLFDHPVYMFNPREGVTAHSWTQSPVPGNTLAHKPVYVLTSATTVSAAEQFSYNLKMLRRATLLGETTQGGAHAGVFHRIDDHFAVAVPEVRPVNPYGKADWEGIGVEPDVKLKGADALRAAEKLAEQNPH